MPPDNPWSDPRTWITLGSFCVGAAGFLFGVLSFYWNRRESRLGALSEVLKPMIQAAQKLHQANANRRNCETLRRSFPSAELAKEAAARINQMVDDYNRQMDEAQTAVRLAESELMARSFRFPDAIVRLVEKARDALSEFGKLVNNGYFDSADLAFAKFSDDYQHISRAGRGWRLLDPLEGLRKRFRRHKEEKKQPEDEFELSEDDVRAILDLVHKRATTQANNTFAVHPPKKLIDKPEIATSDDVVKELSDSVFVVVFQDGTTRMMPLNELMFFVYNLIFVAYQYAQLPQMLSGIPSDAQGINVSVKVRMSMTDIMRPEMVKLLLSKVEFSTTPSDK